MRSKNKARDEIITKEVLMGSTCRRMGSIYNLGVNRIRIIIHQTCQIQSPLVYSHLARRSKNQNLLSLLRENKTEFYKDLYLVTD